MGESSANSLPDIDGSMVAEPATAAACKKVRRVVLYNFDIAEIPDGFFKLESPLSGHLLIIDQLESVEFGYEKKNRNPLIPTASNPLAINVQSTPFETNYELRIDFICVNRRWSDQIRAPVLKRPFTALIAKLSRCCVSAIRLADRPQYRVLDLQVFSLIGLAMLSFVRKCKSLPGACSTTTKWLI